MSKPWYTAYLLIWGVSQATWGNLARFRAFVGVRRVPNPVRRALYMRRALVKFALWGGFVCVAPLYVCAALWKTTPTSLQMRASSLTNFAMFLYDLDLHNDLDFCGNLYIKTLKSWV